MQYDLFQKKAISSVEDGNSVIVCAPTGSGKTAIAEYVINKCIEHNQGVVYTAPIKALSNQKFRDFSRIYKKHIGILTGDVSLNSQAPVLIMTTEIFRNTLLEDPQRFNNISWVIFDEVHYIDDPERGTVWEESIIFCPAHMRILALSATVPNAKQIAAWIRKIHNHPIQTIIEKNRPVPLHHIFQAQNKIFLDINSLRKNIFIQNKPKHYSFRKKNKRAPFNRLSDLLKHVQNNNQSPVIYFSFSRKRCEELAFETKNFDFLNLLTASEKTELSILFQNLLKKYDLENEPSAKRLYPIITNGIAFHHAGLLPSLKEVIEQLFTSRLIKLIFTTETFALGINMPAKTVIFDELRKFYGFYFANLRCRDYYQMAGRAGRRGIDTEGFVYFRVNPYRMDFNELEKIIFGVPEPIHSQFNLSYATLLHLYQKWKDQLYNVYPLTLHYYQATKNSRKNAIVRLRSKISLLKELQYIKNNELTVKGKFASSVYGYELIITELFSCGILENLSSINLLTIIGALVFEPRKNQTHIKLNTETMDMQKKIAPLINSIIKKERKLRIHPLSKKAYFNLYQAIEKWSHGESLSSVKSYTQSDEGEIVRYFRMIIQILRQLSVIPFVDKSFKLKIQEALRMINRDEIDAEKQLREGL
ncbi:MAG: DEAD/DEAH box helicase [Candidatus Omnitrophota bacterium]